VNTVKGRAKKGRTGGDKFNGKPAGPRANKKGHQKGAHQMKGGPPPGRRPPRREEDEEEEDEQEETEGGT
jgi:hypothetical protein